MLPADQIHHSMLVVIGHMNVLGAERRRLFTSSPNNILSQLRMSFSTEFPPVYRSSAILATIPSCVKSPNTRDRLRLRLRLRTIYLSHNNKKPIHM